MKVTPHTIFIYSSGGYLRVVRGEHQAPQIATKPRIYKTVKEALENERRPRIVNALKLFPADKVIDRRLKAIAAPVKVKQHRTLAQAIKSPLFTFAQLGYDAQHREVGYVYHRDPGKPTGVQLASSGKAITVRKLLKKYKRPALRGLDYQERKPKVAKPQKEIAA
jgi:hypothetical protein